MTKAARARRTPTEYRDFLISSRAEPEVRIHLPPAVSLQTFSSREGYRSPKDRSLIEHLTEALQPFRVDRPVQTTQATENRGVGGEQTLDYHA